LTPDFAAAVERVAGDLADVALVVVALAAAVLATDVFEAAVLAVLAAAALTVFFAALAFSVVFVFGVFVFGVFVLLLVVLPGVVFVVALAPLADALTARDVLDLDSPSLAPPLALDDALRFLAVFLLEGIRGYSLSLSRCGDGTGSHMAEEAKPRPDQDSANDRAYFRLAKARRFTLQNRGA
jgi:hypothetical protein